MNPANYPKGGNCRPPQERAPGDEWTLSLGDFFLSGGRFTDRYGVRTIGGREEWHNGLDLAPGLEKNAGFGALVFAPCDGIISRVRVGGSKNGIGDRIAFWPFGKCVPWLNFLHVCATGEIRNKLNISVGTNSVDHVVKFPVRKGQIIGFCNDTGRVSGAHIHLQLWSALDGKQWCFNPETRVSA